MPVYGDSLKDWADRLKDLGPGGRRDWSIDVAVHLGLAYAALEQLKILGIETTAGQRQLVEKALEEAWREILFIRMRNVPVEIVQSDVPRYVTLTRNGRIINGTDQNRIPTQTRRDCNPNDQPQSYARTKSGGRSSRYRGAGTDESH